MSNEPLIKAFRAAAVLEACSWLGLLIGMYFKWIAKSGEAGVKIFGPIHGVIFISYVLLAVVVARRLRWPVRWTTLLALVASVPPFATVLFELWADRTGRLQPKITADAAAAESAQVP
jgi:integral membrane protein